ncbi:MAG: hypothetical protein QNJ91_07640 [Gammaproteobacteria bacterium]|nr:hypothetical protein [Gammaproteobacteria bacterium]
MVIVMGCTVLDQRRIEQCVEALCHKGCQAVWADINALESGKPLPEVDGLSNTEVRAVVRELRAVMAVYRGNCAAG